MDVLNLFSSWVLSAFSVISSVVFTQWGFFGSALFTLPLLRKLIKIFKGTY